MNGELEESPGIVTSAVWAMQINVRIWDQGVEKQVKVEVHVPCNGSARNYICI